MNKDLESIPLPVAGDKSSSSAGPDTTEGFVKIPMADWERLKSTVYDNGRKINELDNRTYMEWYIVSDLRLVIFEIHYILKLDRILLEFYYIILILTKKSTINIHYRYLNLLS